MRADPWLLGAALLFLVGAGEVRRFERNVARDLSSRLEGEERSVTVSTKPAGLFGYTDGRLDRVTVTASKFRVQGIPFFTDPSLSQGGRVKRVVLKLDNFHLRGLMVDKLRGEIPNCRFDWPHARSKGALRVSRSGIGTVTVTLSEKEIEAYLLRKYSGLKSASLRLKDGKAHIVGRGEFGPIRAGFEVSASIVSTDGSGLHFADAAILLENQIAGPDVGAMLLAALNPIVDLDKDLMLYGAIRIENVVLGNGLLVASGRLLIPEQPPAQQVD